MKLTVAVFLVMEECMKFVVGGLLLAGRFLDVVVVVVLAATVVRLVIVVEIALPLRLTLYMVVVVEAAATLAGRC